MGTSGSYGFYYKGLYILFYNHSDSYDLCDWIINELQTMTELDIDTLKHALANHIQINTIQEGTDNFGIDNYEGLMKAAQNPSEYTIDYVSYKQPGENEYTYIVDLDAYVLHDTWMNTSIPLQNYLDLKSKTRIQKRCLTVKEDLMAAAWHPNRVEKWINTYGIDILDTM